MTQILKGKYKLIKDFGLNIFATLVLTFSTQILAYPFISRIVTIEEYGLVLTIMGIVNIVGVSLGNPLNNTRILLQSEYDKNKLNGDYNPLFSILLLSNIIVVFTIVTIFYKSVTITVIGTVIVSSLILFRSNFTADYRINLNYKKNLYASLFGFIGYIIGIFISYFSELWIMIFIFGELFSCIYIFLTAKIVFDQFKLTSLFRLTFSKFFFIMIGAVLSSLIVYMDRFMIFPLLGADQVSIFNVASFLGKTVGILLGPVAGVLLSYYVKEEGLSVRDFYLRIITFILISVFFYILILFLGFPFINILYPSIAAYSESYYAIANLGAMVFILGNLIQPTLLRYGNVKWQAIIQGIYFVLYLIGGLLGMKYFGLMGFCYSILIVNIFRVIIMMSVTTWSLKSRT